MSAPASNATKHLTVLVVEDEDPIRMLVQYSLEGRGYKVLCASDGFEALDIARDYEGIIDLLITDLIMPGLSGTELVEKVHAFRPYMKILVMSGNADPISELSETTGINVLAKPFSPSQLLDTVRTISK